MKKIIIIASLSTLAFVLFAMYVASFIPDPFNIQSRKNRSAMIEYIKENYGNDYKILRRLRTGYASEYDVFFVSQHGIEYRVESISGRVIEDTYNSEMAGKIFGEHLLSVVGEPDYDFKLSCGASFNEAFTKDTSFDEVTVNSAGIILNLYDVPICNFREFVWLYELYQILLSYDLESFGMTLNVSEGIKGDTTSPCMRFSGSYLHDTDFTEEEFFDQFEYREG